MTNNKELQKLYGSPLCPVCFGQSFVCENCPYKEQGEDNFKKYTDKMQKKLLIAAKKCLKGIKGD